MFKHENGGVEFFSAMLPFVYKALTLRPFPRVSPRPVWGFSRSHYGAENASRA